jgi:hypothetical protein
MNKFGGLLLTLLLCGLSPLAAQWGMTPLDTTGRNWKVIRTEHYDVIFPEGLEKEGRHAADSLKFLFPLQQGSLKPVRHHRYPVILYPDYLGTNGFVSWMPRRSVFYGTPTSQFNGDWISTLAVHEGRHMVQLDAIDRNTVHAVYFLYGELAFLPGMPFWWLEGDAVMTETIFTDTGRGRDPGFTAPFKALMLEGKYFEYNKMMLGSQRDYIPDHYVFGYLMQAYLRSHDDPMVPEIFSRTWSQIPLPVIGPTVAMKRSTGKVPRKIYRVMAEEYAAFWKDQVSALPLTDVRVVHDGDKKHYSSHRQLAFLSNGTAAVSLLDIKNGYGIMLYGPGSKKGKLLTRAYTLNNLTAGGTLLAWDELITDAKYDSTRTRIVLWDTATGKKKCLIGSGRYLYPALSPDGKKLAVTEWRDNYTSRLVIFDTVSLEVLSEVPVPDGEFWCELSWSDDGQAIVLISNGSGGKSLKRFRPLDGSTETLLPPGNENLGQPHQTGNTVHYVSNYSGIDSLYALLPDGQRYQTTVRPIASGEPAVNPLTGELWFVDYASSLGTVLAALELDPQTWTPLDRITVIREEFYKPVEAFEPGAGLYSRETVPEGTEPVEDYSFSLSGNRLHTWGVDPFTNGLSQTPSVNLFADIDNIAGTATQKIQLGYYFNEPAVSLDYSLLLRKYRPDFSVATRSMMRDLSGDPFNETQGSVGISLPMGQSVIGGFSWNLTPGTTLGGAARVDLDGTIRETILPLTHTLTANAGYDRWAISVLSGFTWQPLADDFRYHFAGSLGLQSPGPFSRDTLTLTGSYEVQNSGNLSLVPFSRGWDAEEMDHIVKGSIDYRFPLLYPDLAAGGIAYLTRITGDLFFDYLRDMDTGNPYSSTGAEIRFHFYPLQIPLELDVGFRFAWQIESGLPRFELLLVGIPIGLN